MSYHYPKTVVVIADNYDNYISAQKLFAKVFSNAVLVDSLTRINQVHKVATKDSNRISNNQGHLSELLRTHDYLIKVLNDANYVLMDIQKQMLKNSTSTNKERFNVILMLDGLFSHKTIRQLRARKIYFYDTRNNSIDPPLKSNYCSENDDDWKLLGFTGSMTHIQDSVETIYRQMGFKV